MELRRIVVRGKVQGVWYRKHTRAKALELGLKGWVMNLPDGSVLIEAEGHADALDALEDWCRSGPPNARVDGLERTTGPLAGHPTFDVRH